jgi:predicted nucleic acid-binding protein
MTWCFEDEKSSYADRVLSRLSKAGATVPSVWPLEVVNVLLVAERNHRLSESDSVRFLELLRCLPIFIEQEPPARILGEVMALARRYRLSSYDASYLDLAMREGVPIATLDKKLRQAAKRSKVPLLD